MCTRPQNSRNLKNISTAGMQCMLRDSRNTIGQHATVNPSDCAAGMHCAPAGSDGLTFYIFVNWQTVGSSSAVPPLFPDITEELSGC